MHYEDAARPDKESRPARRVRYSGKNPRKFEQKYKELRRDPDTLARVEAAGKTPAGTHRPIMPEEVLECLALEPGAMVLDGTLGYGGHTELFLQAVSPGGRVNGLDVDPVQLPLTTARLRAAGWEESAFIPVASNFAGAAAVLGAQGLADGVDAFFLDLGVSSMQIDDPVRGFSWKHDGPVDMRLNPARGVSAAEFLRQTGPEKLARLLDENADEPMAVPLAQLLSGKSFTSTRALAAAIREHAAQALRLRVGAEEEAERTIRRVFQALRIAVNGEFSALDAVLRALPDCLRPGGRAAILTFHSGEDRRVKRAFRDLAATGEWELDEEPQPVRASQAEQRANPRSTSAKLRWIQRNGVC